MTPATDTEALLAAALREEREAARGAEAAHLRRARIVARIVELCGGNQSEAARRIGIDHSRVNRLVQKARAAQGKSVTMPGPTDAERASYSDALRHLRDRYGQRIAASAHDLTKRLHPRAPNPDEAVAALSAAVENDPAEVEAADIRAGLRLLPQARLYAAIHEYNLTTRALDLGMTWPQIADLAGAPDPAGARADYARLRERINGSLSGVASDMFAQQVHHLDGDPSAAVMDDLLTPMTWRDGGEYR